MKYLNKIVHGDCTELIQELPDESLDSSLIDPPYGEDQGYEGDRTLGDASVLLSRYLAKLFPKLKQNGHVAIFWTMRNVDIPIDALKSNGYTYRRVISMYIPKGGARPYLGWLPRTQAIVIGQRYVPGQPSEFHWELSEYLKKELESSDYTRSSLARELKCDSRLVMKWTRPGDWAWCLPTPRFYPRLKELLKLDDRYDFLLIRQSAHQKPRKDFKYHHDCYIVDDKLEKMIHPAQKPLSVVEHLVTCITPENGIVLDGFGGSGTTAVAAKNTNRNFICFETSEPFCEIAKKRLKGER